MGKRFLHGFFGMIIGAGIGFGLLRGHYLIGIIGGAVVGACLAFFKTDSFWESLKDFLSLRHW